MLHVLATGYMGYSAEEKAYTIDVFNSLGGAEHSKGTIVGNRWIFGSPDKTERYTITVNSPTSYSYKLELAPKADGKYFTVPEGTKTKVSLR